MKDKPVAASSAAEASEPPGSAAASDLRDAWAGLEPTFQTEKSVRKWKKLSAEEGGEDAYFEDTYMLKMERKTAKAMKKRYREQQRDGASHCIFETVELEKDSDPWKTRRQTLHFHGKERGLERLSVHLTIDAETFEYGIKPVPLECFYDERFVAFLEAMVWQVPLSLGMSAAIGHGGAQFHLSVKPLLQGSLLADTIAHKLNHPELASWTMDYPQVDDRSFRATRERKCAFESILKEYWEGKFHPRAIGALTPENVYVDRGFGPAPRAAAADM